MTRKIYRCDICGEHYNIRTKYDWCLRQHYRFLTLAERPERRPRRTKPTTTPTPPEQPDNQGKLFD